LTIAIETNGEKGGGEIFIPYDTNFHKIC